MNVVTSTAKHYIERYFQYRVQQFAHAITRSPHLHDDDVLMLLQLDENIMERPVSFLSSSPLSQIQRITANLSFKVLLASCSLVLWGTSLVCISVLGLVRWNILPKPKFWSQQLEYTITGISVGSVIGILLHHSNVIGDVYRQLIPESPLNTLHHLLQTREAFVLSCHRTLSLLHRIELSNRGFGLAANLPPITCKYDFENDTNGSSTNYKDQDRCNITLNRSRASATSENESILEVDCATLRMCLKECLFQSLQAIRSLTLQSINSHPLHPTIDEPRRCLATNSYHELGRCTFLLSGFLYPISFVFY